MSRNRQFLAMRERVFGDFPVAEIPLAFRAGSRRRNWLPQPPTARRSTNKRDAHIADTSSRKVDIDSLTRIYSTKISETSHLYTAVGSPFPVTPRVSVQLVLQVSTLKRHYLAEPSKGLAIPDALTQFSSEKRRTITLS